MKAKWAVLVAALVATATWAGPIDFTKVIDTGPFLTNFYAPAYNDNAEVAFWGTYTSTGNSGLFTASAPWYGPIGAVNTVVDNSAVYTGFGLGTVDLNTGGDLVFYAEKSGGVSGVYVFNGSSVDNIYETSTAVSGRPDIDRVGYRPSINDGGEVAFTIRYDDFTNGSYHWDGSTVNELWWSYLGGTGPQEHLDINNSGTVVGSGMFGESYEERVSAWVGGVQSYWANGFTDDSLSQIGSFPVLNQNGEVLFVAHTWISPDYNVYQGTASGYSAVYNGDFVHESVSFNNNGTFLFTEIEDPATLYAWHDSQFKELLKVGDIVDGKEVEYFLTGSHALNNDDAFAIYLKFTDQSEGVFVAGLNAVPEPASLLFLVFGGALLRRRRRSA